MANFIEEFYYGNLDPQARSTKENKTAQKQMEVLLLNEDFLAEHLSGESKKKFLDFCRLNKITIQPWSPMQYGFFGGCFIDDERFPELNQALEEIATAYGVSKTTIAFAWILRHPAKMQPITGTTNTQRLCDCLKAADITLSRGEWYKIYKAAGNKSP